MFIIHLDVDINTAGKQRARRFSVNCSTFDIPRYYCSVNILNRRAFDNVATSIELGSIEAKFSVANCRLSVIFIDTINHDSIRFET